MKPQVIDLRQVRDLSRSTPSHLDDVDGGGAHVKVRKTSSAPTGRIQDGGLAAFGDVRTLKSMA